MKETEKVKAELNNLFIIEQVFLHVVHQIRSFNQQFQIRILCKSWRKACKCACSSMTFIAILVFSYISCAPPSLK